jgi:hypothetical protein
MRNSLPISQVALALLLCGATLVCKAGDSDPKASGPPAIRVEAPEVVVPVVVLERNHFRVERDALFEEDQEITDLSKEDFHVFEDGIERPIRNVALELPHIRHVRDNVSHHLEASFTPRGIWSSPDLWPETDTGASLSPLKVYLVSYSPPPSLEGSCHRIKVQVKRRHATVYSRDTYCNTSHPLSDPLNGTELGQRMEEYGSASEDGALPVNAQASPSASFNDGSRVEIAVDFPWDAVKRKWHRVNLYANVAVLGLVYDQNHVIVARFSDMASTTSWNYYRGPLPPDWHLLKEWEMAGIPSHYQTQIELPAGNYDLQVVITDGEKFGRAEVPVNIEAPHPNGLAISGIVLCKRFQEVEEGAQTAVRAPQYVPLVSNGKEFTPTGDKRFTRDEGLVGFFEISRPTSQVPGDVHFQVRITDPATGEVKIESGAHTLETSDGGNALAIPVAAEIGIAKLPPGKYRVNVQASDEHGKNTGWRTACFAVDR